MVYPIIARPSGDGEALPFYLLEHLEVVTELIVRFTRSWGGEKIARIAASLHDLGKYNPEWQQYVRGLGPRVPHSDVGALHAWLRCKEAGEPNIGRLIAFVIAAHHTGLANYREREHRDGGVYRRPLYDRLDDPEARGRLDASLSANPPVDILNFEVPKWDDRFDFSMLARMILSALVDADRLHADGRAPIEWQKDIMQTALSTLEEWSSAKFKSARGVVNRERRALLTACRESATLAPGLFTLSAPTGLGKSLSGLDFCLRHAAKYGKERVIYIAPYTSIIDQTARIFRNVLGPSMVTEHHSNIDLSPEAEKCPTETERQTKARENWDAPVIVTTHVQLFETLYAARPTKLRKMHRMANSVIFIDEVQSLPPEHLNPILKALDELMRNYKVTVVLSTATMPDFASTDGKTKRFQLLGAREIVPDVKGLHERMGRVKLCLPPPSEIMTLEDLSSELRGIRKVLCVVNTRSRAVNLHKLMPEGTFFLSGDMCTNHRREVISKIQEALANKRSRKPVRVVSTSVIEAGVDIDFPVVYREMAGLDSLIQSGGRCNRHGLLKIAGRKALGTLKVFRLAETESRLRGTQSIAQFVTKDFIADFRENIFAPETTEMFFTDWYAKIAREMSLDKGNTIALSTIAPSFQTIADQFKFIESKQETVLVPYGDGGRAAIDAFERAAKGEYVTEDLFAMMQGFTVSVWPEAIKRMDEAGHLTRLDKYGIWFTSADCYDTVYGVAVSEKS